MHRLYIISFLICFSIFSFAQDPHIFNRESSMPELTDSIRQQIREIPIYKPKISYKASKSLAYIDNSKHKFFPPIFNQKGNSCSQSSGIRYIFTYEINRIRNTDASLNQNIYSYHYTWNFLNGGSDVGSWYYDGYKLVKGNGAPSLNEFNDESGLTEKTWMTGYNKYYKAIHNKISDYSQIQASEEGGLNLIKQYLIDHGDGSETGGLLNFSGKSSNWDMIGYNGTSNTNYHYAIKSFGDGGDHAMTIVGFDDSIKVDVDNNGEITEDEIGALIIANSWGSGWGSNGRAYMPYKLIYKSWTNGGMGNGDHNVYVMEAKDHTPSVVAKININYTSRNDLRMKIGVSESADAANPDKTKTMEIFNKQGGDYYMQGSNSESAKNIEIGLDLSDLIDKIPNAKKFFLTVIQSPVGILGNGTVEQFSIMDYRNSTTPKEYVCTEKNSAILYEASLSVSSEQTTGLIDFNNPNKIQLFPNPVNRGSLLHINLKDKVEITRIGLIDITGKLINLDYSVNNLLIDIVIPDNILGGVYFISIYGTQNIIKHKLLIY